jgi:hypothetical protein
MDVKKYSIMYNIGTIKYLVNYYDGIKKHNDGSRFYDIAIFKNKKLLNKFIENLQKNNYIMEV